jgi:hypothetical protein
VAAVDSQDRFDDRYRAGWLARRCPVSRSDCPDAARFMALDNTGSGKLFVWPLLLVGTTAFVASYLIGGLNFSDLVRTADRGRRDDVRAGRTILVSRNYFVNSRFMEVPANRDSTESN